MLPFNLGRAVDDTVEPRRKAMLDCLMTVLVAAVKSTPDASLGSEQPQLVLALLVAHGRSQPHGAARCSHKVYAEAVTVRQRIDKAVDPRSAMRSELGVFTADRIDPEGFASQHP